MTEESIIKPKPVKGVETENALYIPCDSESGLIRKILKGKAQRFKPSVFGDFYFMPGRVILYGCMGSPLAVISLERLIVSGVKNIILLGFCGSLDPAIRILDAMSITKSYSEEGTSPHYFPHKKSFIPSTLLKNHIENEWKRKKLLFSEAAIVTTDAPFRETKTWLSRQKKKQIQLVDMETSAVFALANYHKIRSAALMLVSDEVSHQEWKAGFRSKDFDHKIETYFLPFLLSNLIPPIVYQEGVKP